jgi:hypothetical protein
MAAESQLADPLEKEDLAVRVAGAVAEKSLVMVWSPVAKVVRQAKPTAVAVADAAERKLQDSQKIRLPDGTWLWDYGRGGNGTAGSQRPSDDDNPTSPSTNS